MATSKPSGTSITIERKYVEGHIGMFILTAVFVLLTIVLTAVDTRFFHHAAGMWIIALVGGILLFALCYFLARRDDNLPANSNQSANWWVLILACIIYTVSIVGTGATQRTDRQEACIPGKVLTPEKTPQEWIDFYSKCPSSNLLLDEPAKDYILTNHKLPDWLMQKDGHTSNPVGWWRYYSSHPKNPYKLDQSVQTELYNTYTLPRHTLDGN